VTLRLGLLVGWLLLVAAPLGVWWWRARGRVDAWRHLPVPGAIVAADGRRVAVTGPGRPPAWPDGMPLPPAGTLRRERSADGTPLAAAGVRGGAVVVAAEGDPGLAARHARLSGLVPLVQHELRGGLQAVLGHLALAGDAAGPTEAAHRLAVCRRETTRLIELLDGAELLARLTATEPGRHPVSAAALVEEAAASLAGSRPATADRLRVELPDPALRVQVAAWQIVHVLHNLTENALRYSEGPVLLEAHLGGPAGDRMVFGVHDTGAGVDPQQLDRLCEPFVRGNSAVPGTGLGLAVSAAALAGHGSRLATSATEQGATFSFSLPVGGAE
jgi:signal transduction histidine kinase